MDTIERLAAIEDIKQVQARYCRCIDTKEWEGFAALFTADAVMDHSQSTPGSVHVGVEEIVAFVSGGTGGVFTLHHCHSPEIEVTSPTTARGVWAMEDIVGPMGESRTVVHGFGHYHETYDKIDGTWKIKSTRLTRLMKSVTTTALGVS